MTADVVTVVSFAELDAATAYAVWRLRQDVFVVEQQCAYPDLDGRDPEPGTRHVLLRDGDELVGCARVLDDAGTGPGGGSVEWRIGRVALTVSARGQGRAAAVMTAALGACAGRDVVLDAQAPLAGFYTSFGFLVDGAEFLEDGIAHVPMRLRRS